MEKKNALQIAGEAVSETASFSQGIELGVQVGHFQSMRFAKGIFDLAFAKTAKKIKDEGIYESTGLTWDRFCSLHLKCSRVTADEAIKNLNQYGETFYTIRDIVPMSAGSFGLIAGKVDAEGFEIDGEKVPVTAANADRIRKAVDAIRKESLVAKREAESANAAAEKARTERDNAQKAAADARRKLHDAQTFKMFGDVTDEDYRQMLEIQAKVDAALLLLRKIRGRKMSGENEANYTGLCEQLYCKFVRAVDDAKVSFACQYDQPDPELGLYLDNPASGGKDLIAEHSAKKRRS